MPKHCIREVKQVITNVRQFFQDENDKNEPTIDIKNVVERTAKAVGVSTRTVEREQFRVKELDELFTIYTYKINHGYFSLFLILQLILLTTHFFVVLFANMEPNTLDKVALDLILYAIVALLSAVGLFISEKYMKNYSKHLRNATTASFFIMFLTDILIPIYCYVQLEEAVRPAFTTHLIIACYIFFNVPTNFIAILLGLLVTLTHVVILFAITYTDSTMKFQRAGSDVIYLLCINGLGLYFRLMNELVKKRSFLDRRACVESTLKLKYEKDQEEQLMLSIIPEHIINEVRKDMLQIQQYQSDKFQDVPVQKLFEHHYIKEHDNVSILYADIVNYTQMTSTLKSGRLVETLNELFGRFDDASEDLSVMRIKFLGDCYYCVAGLPPKENINHAEACVDLGLRMIKIIRDVRESCDLDIDMRIGVHTGRILSGVIGVLKWQFDIWSKDVFIANRMETTGKPGKVHITMQTKNLLKKPYHIVRSDAGANDAQLQQYNLETFFIAPQHIDEINSIGRKSPKQDNHREKNHTKLDIIGETPRTSLVQNGTQDQQNTRRDSKFKIQRNSYIVSGRASGNPTLNQINRRRYTPGEVKRRTAFMDNNIRRYYEQLKNIDKSMKEAIEILPLSKRDQWFKVDEINPFFMIFRNLGMELKFLKLPDPLFKYYLLSEIVIIASIIVIQNLTQPDWNSWLGYGTIAFIIFILVPLSWTNYLWHSCRYDEDEQRNMIVNFFYSCSEFLTISVSVRTFIYVITCALFTASVLMELIDCQPNFNVFEELNKTKNIGGLLKAMKNYGRTGSDNTTCVKPWHITQTCALAIIMNFLFLRIHIWLKLLFGVVITTLYSFFIWESSYEDFLASETYNYKMEPPIAHVLSIAYLTVTLHFIDRQTDYMNRLDFKWNVQLTSEQENARTMRKINSDLLNNILPKHVAAFYLNTDRQTGMPYYEEYTMEKPVAVMFASLVDYSIELPEETFLQLMNQIIRSFDSVLDQNYGKTIEKIKVTNWTYMAACGLDPGRRNSIIGEDNIRRPGEHVVITLLKFATEMMNVLVRENESSAQEYKLRIGISHGEVTAGVVGSKKPLYDVWGDAVNMAARMDTTGIPNKIQVTENTANIIRENHYNCQFRDYIYVKGKSTKIPTYFVNLDNMGHLTKL